MEQFLLYLIYIS